MVFSVLKEGVKQKAGGSSKNTTDWANLSIDWTALGTTRESGRFVVTSYIIMYPCFISILMQTC